MDSFHKFILSSQQILCLCCIVDIPIPGYPGPILRLPGPVPQEPGPVKTLNANNLFSSFECQKKDSMLKPHNLHPKLQKTLKVKIHYQR